MSASLELKNGLRTLSGSPADSKYFNISGTPYVSIEQVLSELPIGIRSLGLKVNVNKIDYCFRNGTGDGDLEIDQIVDSNKIEGIYAELKALVDADKLIIGAKYILTDYRTKYFINGSNSSGVVRKETITSVVANYAVMSGGYVSDLLVNGTVIVTELPIGYTGTVQVGDTTRVTVASSEYYFRFANNMHLTIGIKFEFFLQRYTTIEQDSVIMDTHNKPVMKPMGVVNTEVHDGTPYMDHTGEENLTVPTERLVLTASTNNTFDSIAYSDTFKGDVVEYDFNSTNVVNDNGEIIDTRNGLITKRTTFDGNISLPLDWRVCRFRRWLIDEQSRVNFCNRDLDPTTTRVGYDGKHLFESKNRLAAHINYYYIALEPERELSNIDENAMRKTFMPTLEGLYRARDYNCFKIDNNYTPINVYFVRAKTWYNTVVQGNEGEFNYPLTISLQDAVFSQTTFTCNPKISNGYGLKIDASIFLDSVSIINTVSSSLENCQFLSNLIIWDMSATFINKSIFGTLNSRLSGMNSTVSWTQFRSLTDVDIDNSVFGNYGAIPKISTTTIYNSSIHFGDGRSEGAYSRNSITLINNNLSKVGMRLLNLGERITFRDISTPNSNDLDGNVNGLFLYDNLVPLSRLVIEMNRYDYRLYSTDIDTNNQISINTIMTPQ